MSKNSKQYLTPAQRVDFRRAEYNVYEKPFDPKPDKAGPVEWCRLESTDQRQDDFGCVYCDKPIRTGDTYYWMDAHGGNPFCCLTCKENWLYFLNYEWNAIQANSNKVIQTRPLHLTRDELYLVKRAVAIAGAELDEEPENKEALNTVWVKLRNLIPATHTN